MTVAERLRKTYIYNGWGILKEAAEEIDELRGEVERLNADIAEAKFRTAEGGCQYCSHSGGVLLERAERLQGIETMAIQMVLASPKGSAADKASEGYTAAEGELWRLARKAAEEAEKGEK